MNFKRVTIVAGHYGSGKTNIAINLALEARRQELPVVCADLDIVNPYFRTKDSEALLRQHGIDFISSAYANSNVDMPAIPPEAYSILDNRKRYAVIDLGGDDMGARALGRYRRRLLEENDFACLWVVNPFRPLTNTVELALEAKAEIEAAAGLPFTAIVNNTNLSDETTAEDIYNSLPFMEELSAKTGLPIAFTCCTQDLFFSLQKDIINLFPVTLYLRQGWNKKGE